MEEGRILWNLLDKLILSSDVKNSCEQVRDYPRKQCQHSGFKVGKFLLNSRPFQEGTDLGGVRGCGGNLGLKVSGGR